MGKTWIARASVATALLSWQKYEMIPRISDGNLSSKVSTVPSESFPMCLRVLVVVLSCFSDRCPCIDASPTAMPVTLAQTISQTTGGETCTTLFRNKPGSLHVSQSVGIEAKSISMQGSPTRSYHHLSIQCDVCSCAKIAVAPRHARPLIRRHKWVDPQSGTQTSRWMG